MPKLKTIRAFSEWVKEEENIEDLLRRVMEGVPLHELCKQIKQPYTLVYPFLHSSPELQERYEAALAAVAEKEVHESKQIADEAKPGDKMPQVAARKLRCDVRFRRAAYWNSARYGEKLQVEKNVRLSADAALVGFAGDLLLKRKPAVTVEAVELEAIEDKSAAK